MPLLDDASEQRRAAEGARRAVTGLARDRGAELTTRPLFPGSELTRPDLEPLDGARAARDIELGARGAARGYLRAAREAGDSWSQIGQVLGLTLDARRSGDTLGEAAYAYATGSPDSQTAMRYDRSFTWHCPSCDQVISDRGLIAGPRDNEPGHADSCARQAAAIAAWDASWEAEP